MIEKYSLEKWAFKKNELIKQNQSIGFVPTMGALHDGHISLVERSLKENDYTLVSLFLNPTQFNSEQDLENYPKDTDLDISKLDNQFSNAKLGVLIPSFEKIYPDNYNFKITESIHGKGLCGENRKGHFDGVMTVVLKLLNISGAQKAYFGEKDYQQYVIIKEMASAFFLPIQILACPTVREMDGLAMSSRNKVLSQKQREIAPLIYKNLKKNLNFETMNSELSQHGITLEYLEYRWQRKICAAHIGEVRLIDNIAWK